MESDGAADLRWLSSVFRLEGPLFSFACLLTSGPLGPFGRQSSNSSMPAGSSFLLTRVVESLDSSSLVSSSLVSGWNLVFETWLGFRLKPGGGGKALYLFPNLWPVLG